MGEGLKRAASAAKRTRWDGTLTPHMRRFLYHLAAYKDAVTRSDLGCVTSLAEEKARQQCRKLGLARVGRQKSGARRQGWIITPAGRRALPSPDTRGTREA